MSKKKTRIAELDEELGYDRYSRQGVELNQINQSKPKGRFFWLNKSQKSIIINNG